MVPCRPEAPRRQPRVGRLLGAEAEAAGGDLMRWQGAEAEAAGGDLMRWQGAEAAGGDLMRWQGAEAWRLKLVGWAWREASEQAGEASCLRLVPCCWPRW